MMLSVMVMSTGAVTLTDSEDISPQYREAAEVLTGMGIINGYEDDSFKPQQSITRAEVAAMIYRVATGDVEDEKADINAGAKLFTDVNADDWFAGYVNYCGDAEYIKGYEDDSFRADNDVTGYEVLAMILRAVGYDKNKEFTGPTWTINVASTATELGMLENLDNSVNLAEPATREVVAELIFRAIVPGVPTVNYVPAIGDYLPDTWGHSLGEQVFKLELDPNTTDDWGRPNDTWKYNTGDEKTVIEEEALATYTTAVKICDVADDLGIADKQDFTTYTNGKADANTDEVTINANATKATIGEQGRLTEVYEDTIVYIDTFLAKVTNVVGSETDGNGHLDRQALLELEVYNAYRNQSETVYLTSDTDYTYAVGDMLLVNAYTDSADTFVGIATTRDKVEGYVNQYDLAIHLDVAQAAESFVGAQTEDWVNAHKHVIDGETYMDAFRFSLDETFNKTDEYNEEINYNWWLDQYDNIIGVTPLARTGYAVLKDLNWVVGNGGYAEATLVYMDGSEETVEVDTIDGFNFANENWSVDNAVPYLRDNRNNTFFGNGAAVSEDSTNNTAYLGYALYQVYTNDDGSVELEGTRLRTEIIDYDDVATIDVNKSTISAGGSVVARFDGSTQFIVNNGDGTYSAYTRDTLPNFAPNSLTVFWSKDGVYTNNVYIKYSTLFAEDGTHLFTTTDASYREVGGGVHVIDAVVDGVERTIRTVNDDVINTLMANEGKLFHVTFQTDATEDHYGFVTDVALVNEFHDESSCPVTATAECNYTFAVNVIAGTDTVTIIERDGTRESWNTTNATTIVNLDGTTVNYNIETIEQAVENLEVGIWVVEDENGAAAQIYIGTQLTNDDALAIGTITNGGVGEWNGNTYEITIPYDKDSCNVTIWAAAQNAVLDRSGTQYLNPGYKAPETRTLMFNNGLDKGGDTVSAEVTVWAEDGVTHTEYTVKVTRAHMDTTTGILAKIYDKDNNAIVINDSEDLAKLTYYKSLEDAVNASASMNMDKTDTLNVTSLTPGAYSVTYASFSTTAEVTAATDADFVPFRDVDANVINKYLVLKITKADSSPFELADDCTAGAVYIVFDTQA